MHNADIISPGSDGETPLHLASRQGRLEISEALLKYGADVNHQDKDGWTSLHLTSQVDMPDFLRPFSCRC